MRTLKRLVVGITFGAMLATMLLATGGDAYAKSRSGGSTTVTNGTGPVSTPPANDGLFEALGVTWE